MNLPTTCCLALLFLFGLCGCTQPNPPSDVTDRTFATADELLTHINQLLSTDPIDQEGLDPLYYAENDLQRRLERIGRSLRPYEQMHHNVFKRFGAGLDPAMSASPIAPMPPATIVERSDRRAVAKTTYADAQPLNLHLVQIGDEWRISGYTLEFVFESPAEAERILQHFSDGDRVAERARSFMARIDAGEFSTIDEVRAAWMNHLRSP